MKLHDIKCYQFLPGVVISVLSIFTSLFKMSLIVLYQLIWGCRCHTLAEKSVFPKFSYHHLCMKSENITKLTKTRRKVPSSRKDLPTSGDTRHEACCSFVAKCFHGLRLNLGVSTKPESTQMRMSNAYIWHVTPDQSSPAEVWLVQGKSRQEKQSKSNASLQPALQPPPWHSTPSDWCFSPSTSAYVRSYGISPK